MDSGQELNKNGGNTANIDFLKRFHKINQATGVPYDIVDSEMEIYLVREKLKVMVLNNQPYIYKDGCYKLDKDGKELKSHIRELIYPYIATSTRINRVYQLLMMDYELSKTNEEINDYPKHWINFQNGMLDVKTGELHEHNPEYYSVNQIPHIYLKRARYVGSTTDKFLKGLFPDDNDREMVLSYCGYCMTLDTHLQKFLVIVGKPGAGKSTVINLLSHVIGVENVCSVTLQDLNERFTPTNLLNKLLNACGDLPKTALKETDVIKRITGEDLVKGEYKGGDVFSFRSYAKLLFSANEMPVNLDEKSDAFYRRLLIAEVKEKGEQIEDLEQKLFDESEIQGFICECVAALSRLYESKGAIDSPNSKRFVHEYHRESDSVMSFLEDRTEILLGARIDRKTLYSEYDAYCVRNEWMSVSNKTFFSNLRGKGHSEVTVRGIRCFKNIHLKSAP